MPYKMVTRSEKAAGNIAGTALAHAETIAAEEAARWKEQLPAGQEEVTVLQLQQFHARDLLRRRDELLAAERAHLDQLLAVHEIRERRDAAKPRLREKLYEYRDLLKLTHGKEGARAIFKSGPTVPQDATPLRRVARVVVAKLRDPEVELPPARLSGAKLDRSEAAEDIEGPLDEMESAMRELEDRLPVTSRTLEAKQSAHSALDEKLSAFARFMEGFYVLEGHEVLAAKLRPSSHKSKKVDELAKEATAAVEHVLGTDEQRPEPGAPPAKPAASDTATRAARPASASPTPKQIAPRQSAPKQAAPDRAKADRNTKSPKPPAAVARTVPGPVGVALGRTSRGPHDERELRE